MKRLFQSAALAVALLLIAQPLVAAAPCNMEQGSSQCASCCQSSMPNMPANCPMHHKNNTATPDMACTNGCCQNAVPKPTIQWLNDKNQTTKVFALVVQPLSIELPEATLLAPPPGPPPGAHAPRYILNQVFRI